jgi:hypothetical protein
MFQTFNFFKFEQLKFKQLIPFLYEIVNCSNCYCSTFWADNNIIDICLNLVNPFEKVDSSSFMYLFIGSNGVEQSRFRCRAVFLSRWISSRWPISHTISVRDYMSSFKLVSFFFVCLSFSIWGSCGNTNLFRFGK